MFENVYTNIRYEFWHDSGDVGMNGVWPGAIAGMREEGGHIGKSISDGLDMHGLGWVVAVNIQEPTVPTPMSWAMAMGKGGRVRR